MTSDCTLSGIAGGLEVSEFRWAWEMHSPVASAATRRTPYQAILTKKPQSSLDDVIHPSLCHCRRVLRLRCRFCRLPVSLDQSSRAPSVASRSCYWLTYLGQAALLVFQPFPSVATTPSSHFHLSYPLTLAWFHVDLLKHTGSSRRRRVSVSAFIPDQNAKPRRSFRIHSHSKGIVPATRISS